MDIHNTLSPVLATYVKCTSTVLRCLSVFDLTMFYNKEWLKPQKSGILGFKPLNLPTSMQQFGSEGSDALLGDGVVVGEILHLRC